jgi:DNA-binding response OmpR family regulator
MHMNASSKPVVLLVDDDEDFSTMLSLVLNDRGFEARVARDGMAALDLLKSIRPDVLLLDLMMQPMNGFDLYHHIKQIPTCSNIPAFFLTGRQDPTAQHFSGKIGAEAYLTKPIDLDYLETAIRAKLKRP